MCFATLDAVWEISYHVARLKINHCLIFGNQSWESGYKVLIITFPTFDWLSYDLLLGGLL